MDNLADIQVRTFAQATEVTQRSYPPDQRLDAQGLGRYLDRRSLAVVATTRPDGRPHAVVSSYVRRGTTFWLPMSANSVRERNVRQQPWASLVVTEGDHGQHIVVLVEGPVRLVDVDDLPEDVADGSAEDWISMWMELSAKRLLSYASQGTSAL